MKALHGGLSSGHSPDFSTFLLVFTDICSKENMANYGSPRKSRGGPFKGQGTHVNALIKSFGFLLSPRKEQPRTPCIGMFSEGGFSASGMWGWCHSTWFCFPLVVDQQTSSESLRLYLTQGQSWEEHH